MLSASRRIATRPLGSLLASAGAIYRSVSLRRQRRSRSTRQARPHRTSRLSSRSLQGVKLQNKGVIVYTSGLKVHPERKDAVQVQAELQAAFDRHTPHLLAFGSCCQGDRVHCYQGGCGSEGVLLLPFTLGMQGTLRLWMLALPWARLRSLPQGVLVIYFGSAASWRPCNVVWPHQGPVSHSGRLYGRPLSQCNKVTLAIRQRWCKAVMEWCSSAGWEGATPHFIAHTLRCRSGSKS